MGTSMPGLGMSDFSWMKAARSILKDLRDG
jgi:hypothetical protein